MVHKFLFLRNGWQTGYQNVKLSEPLCLPIILKLLGGFRKMSEFLGKSSHVP